MPQILKCVHKSHNFDAKLRPITEICGKLYSVASLILHSILEHFCRPNIVLEMEKNDLDVLCMYRILSRHLIILMEGSLKFHHSFPRQCILTFCWEKFPHGFQFAPDAKVVFNKIVEILIACLSQ